MSLANRLTQLRKQSGSRIQTARSLVAEKKLTDKIKLATASTQNAINSQLSKLDDREIAELLDGEVFKPGLILIRKSFPLNAIHKTFDASSISSVEHLAEKVQRQQLLFIDTETTGLSTAAGTLVFLLGLGEIKGNCFILEQMLLTGLSAEKELLKWFNSKCENKSHFVSYNGKSFDLPLLATRFRLNRIASDILNKKHIDLLHWVRRLHKKQLVDCRLPSVEQYCLGFVRKDDLPGSEAPFVWQALIRSGQATKLPALMQHHAWDIISLAGLLDYSENLLSFQTSNKYDYFSIAKYHLSQKQPQKAKLLLEQNYEALNNEALFLLSQIYRREGDLSRSMIIWNGLNQENYLPAAESLAKYYEHKEKNYSQALIYTQQLLAHDFNESHQYRLRRLQTKLRLSK